MRGERQFEIERNPAGGAAAVFASCDLLLCSVYVLSLYQDHIQQFFPDQFYGNPEGIHRAGKLYPDSAR